MAGLRDDDALRPLQGDPDGHHDHGAGGQGHHRVREDWLPHRARVQAQALPGRRGAHKCRVR